MRTSKLLGGRSRIGVAEICELGLEERMQARGVRVRDRVRGMLRIRERQLCGDIATAVEPRTRDRLVERIEHGEDTPARIGASRLERSDVLRLIGPRGVFEGRRDQPFLAAEVLIQRSPGDLGIGQDRVDTDADALRGGKPLGRGHEPLPRARAFGAGHGSGFYVVTG